jgi:transcription initiation factor TFIID subunit 3
MSTGNLNHALLRPAILQILRAVGFHSARPSVVDTLTDLTAKYIMLLAARTASHAVENHNDPTPDTTDVRLAMADCGLFSPSLTSTEEVWRELLRKPLSEVPDHNGLRSMEAATRDAEDTAEIAEFFQWFDGPLYKEILRIAGLQQEEQPLGENQDTMVIEDYLTALKKKHSKSGEDTRFHGTVLGTHNESKPVKIDGGGPESLKDWMKAVKNQEREKNAAKAIAKQETPDTIMTG